MMDVNIVAPGLLGPWAAQHGEFVCEGLDTPTLVLALSKATFPSNWRDAPTGLWAAQPLEASMLLAVGQTVPENWATAPVTALADGLAVAPGDILMRCDPVHLQPEPHGAQLTVGQALGLSAADADELCTALNASLELQSRIEAPAPDRWYLRLEHLPDIETSSPFNLIGPAVEPAVPRGAQGRHWRTVLTEIQMLLFAHPLNQTREMAGQPTINSLWLWGQGRLPELPFDTIARSVISDSPAALGIALCAGLATGSKPDQGFSALSEGDLADNTIVVCDEFLALAEHGHVERWRASLMDFEQRWLDPLIQAVRDGRCRKLSLYLGTDTPVIVDRAILRRFWRRRQPLQKFVSAW